MYHHMYHHMYQNAAVGEDILTFTVKARLQVAPTKYNLALWYPANHDPFCILHESNVKESVPHVVNGCRSYRVCTLLDMTTLLI